jgi:hypothetical protein
MRKIAFALSVMLLTLLALPAYAQSPNTDTYFYTPGGGGVNGALGMCLNTSNKAVPCSAANVVPTPVAFPPFPVNPATQVAAAPISGNATGTTGVVVGTLAGAATKTTYICGFNVQAIGGTAAVGPITVAGLVGSSQVYQGSSSVAGGTVASASFSPCIPASAVNTPITVTTTAAAGATAVDVNSWGYQL